MLSLFGSISVWFFPCCPGDVDSTRLLYCNSESERWIVGLSVFRTVQSGLATVVISVKNQKYIYSALNIESNKPLVLITVGLCANMSLCPLVCMCGGTKCCTCPVCVCEHVWVAQSKFRHGWLIWEGFSWYVFSACFVLSIGGACVCTYTFEFSTIFDVMKTFWEVSTLNGCLRDTWFGG